MVRVGTGVGTGVTEGAIDRGCAEGVPTPCVAHLDMSAFRAFLRAVSTSLWIYFLLFSSVAALYDGTSISIATALYAALPASRWYSVRCSTVNSLPSIVSPTAPRSEEHTS